MSRRSAFGAVAALPTVEVEALHDLVALARLVQLVDLVAVARADERVRERRAQVAQRDVQPPAQVRDGVEALEPLDDVLARRLVLDGLRVVERVAAVLQVAAVARLPELLVRHAVHEPLEDRVVEALRVDDDAAEVQVHDRDAIGGLARAEALLHQRGERGEVGAVRLEEVDEATLVDGDEPRLLRRGPARRVVALEGSEEGAQHVVVLLVALVLAAVVVREERAPAQLEARAVRQRVVDDGLLVLARRARASGGRPSSRRPRCPR